MGSCGELFRSTLCVVLVGVGGLSLMAQADPDPPLMTCVGQYDGQWAGPWVLTADINPPGDVLWAEIAHLLVLPPPNDGLVLFFCQRNGNDPPGCAFGASEAFLWDPADPANVEHTLPVPQTVGGANDPFCGGSAFASDGAALLGGGTNLVADCGDGPEPDEPWGHRDVWVFDNADYVRATPPYPAFTLTNPFARERWYPTLTQTGDNRIVLLGHFGQPDSAIPAQETARTREYATWNESTNALTWAPTATHFYNYTRPGGDCVNLSEPISTGDYPRVHQLASGQLMQVRNRSKPLDFNACPSVTENERWLDLTFNAPQPETESNTSIHYIDLRSPLVSEWVVSVGGANKEAGCDSGEPLEESDEVVFVKNPSIGSGWTSLPPLKRSRTESNTIVGLNGEMVVIGGYGHDDMGVLASRKRPELFRPSFESGFLFGPALASTDWELLCPQEHSRRYHSVAGLLQDGRIISAGGDDHCDGTPGVLDDGAHSIEVFSPPGLFGGPRPRIQSVSATEVSYGQADLDVEVLLQGGDSGEFRVALLRPASVTHAYDCNQRYVVLAIDANLSSIVEAPAISSLRVVLPSSTQRNAVPPGWYMLTVVNAAGRPAIAKWIRIQP